MPHLKGARLTLMLAAASASFVGRAQAATSTACTVTDNLTTQTARFVAPSTKQNAIIEIHNDGSYIVSIDCNGNGVYTDASDTNAVVHAGPITNFDIQLGGNDAITIIQSDTLVSQIRNISVTEPDNINTVTYTTNGTGNITNHSLVSLEILGGIRDDHVAVNLGGATVSDSAVIVRGDLGRDSDHFDVTGPALLLNSDLDYNIDAGAGHNFVNFADGGAGSVVDNSYMVASIQGANYLLGTNYNDVITETLSGTVQNKSRVFVDTNLGDGDDTYTAAFGVATFQVDPAGPTGSEVVVYARGQQGFDNMSFTDVGPTGVALNNGLVDIALDGGPQPDILVGDWNGLTGSGAFKVHMSGADGYDTLVAAVLTDPGANNQIDVLLEAAATGGIVPDVGKTLYLGLVDPGSCTFGPAGHVVLLGAEDARSYCNYFGNAPNLVLQCASAS